MSERNGASHDACERFAPTLAMLDAPGLDPTERAAALAHLAGCARCQADQAAYAQMDAALRATFGAQAASPLRTAELLAAIGATHEPAPAPHPASQTTQSTIRSFVDLGAFGDTGGKDTVNDFGRQTPAHRPAPIPSLRTDTRPGWSRWTISFGAMAMTLIVIVVAVTLFNMRPHPSGATSATHASATQTAQAQSHTGAPIGGVVMAVSMDSPTDGWAIGLPGSAGTYPTPAGGNAPSSVALFYHYNGSAWAQEAPIGGFQFVNPSGLYLKMLSPTNGWAFDGDQLLLHYDGTAWRAAPITISGVSHVHIQAIDMVTPSQGWAAVYIGGKTRFARFDGTRWTIEPIINLPPDVNASQLTISSITATPKGDVWAVGIAPASPVYPAPTPGVGLVFHHVNSEWWVTAALNNTPAPAGMNPLGISMTSSTSGWIVGNMYRFKTTTEGTNTVMQAALLHYNGASWTSVPGALKQITAATNLQHLAATGPNNIWVEVSTTAGTVSPSGLSINGVFLHYDGKSWTTVTPSLSLNGATAVLMTSVSPLPDGTLWGAGSVTTQGGDSSALFFHYTQGAWSAVTPVASGK